MTMPSLSRFIERMDYYCRVASVGYDWARRWDVYDGGDTDCSALVITCLKEAGFDTGGASYTGNLSGELCARGWVRLAPDLSTGQPGDILLNDANHVAAVLWGEGWGATIGQASIGETGGVYGNQPGDQTGWETNVTAIYDYPWDCILRWTGGDEPEPPRKPEQDPGEPKNNAGLWYRAHVAETGWLDSVRDGQVAGTVGFGAQLEALKIAPPEGFVLEVRAHIAGIGWRTYKGIKAGERSGEGSSKSDPIIGTVGEGRAIEDISIRVTERPKGDKRRLKFRVHQAEKGWKAWTGEGNASGSDGLGIPLEAIQMVLK